MSGSRSARSNGLAEATVKRLVEHLKIYAKDDLTIEQVIPLIEVALRSSAHSRLDLSPYEIVFGRAVPFGIPGEPPATPSDVDHDRVAYYRWLSTELKRLHAAVKQAREDQKVLDKQMYDTAHKTATPTWKVNDKVWLYDNTVKTGSPRVVTRQCYLGPYVIKDIVQGRSDIGPAYQLVDEKTGKILKNSATHDRLKFCNLDRKKFSEHLPRLATGEGKRPQGEPEVALDNLGGQ